MDLPVKGHFQTLDDSTMRSRGKRRVAEGGEGASEGNEARAILGVRLWDAKAGGEEKVRFFVAIRNAMVVDRE
jgi:hypothetical protein